MSFDKELELMQAIERVRELHKPIACGNCGSVTCEAFCDECSVEYGNAVKYPCSTIKALDGDKS